MTLEEILKCRNPVLLEAMSDAELEEIFKPYFPTTRPEHVVKKVNNVNKAAELLGRHELLKAKEQAAKVLKHFNIDLKL